MSRVAVVGLGYVGLPVAVRATEAGHRVEGVELLPGRVEDLRAGRSHVDDVPDERLSRAVRSGRLRFRTPDRPVAVDLHVITVPTPLTGALPDLTAVIEAARWVGACLRRGDAVVLESTSWPGTTEEVVGPVVEDVSGLAPGRDFDLGFSPERIAPSDPHFTFENTPKLVSATTGTALERLRRFYSTLVDTVVPVASPRAAEMAKLVENVFSQVNIALVNELATVCHPLGIDVWEVLDAAETKPHGFLRHDPGPGVGGHCVPVDPAYLAWLAQHRLGRTLRLSDLAQHINDEMPAYVVERVAAALAPATLAGSRVLLLGVSYKAGTSDVRGTPAVPVARGLLAAGAEVTALDPRATRWDECRLVGADALPGELARHDVCVLLADHPEFDPRLLRTHAKLLLDCRGRVAPGPGVVRL